MRVVFPNHMSGRFLDDLATEMNTFVESIFGEDGAKCPAATNGFTPRMDVNESESAYFVTLDLPGVNPDDVHIEMEDDKVVIHGARQRPEAPETTESSETPKSTESTVQRRRERSFGEFRREVKLPSLVDSDAITANYDNGVLSIVMPKKVETKTSRRIVISKGTNPE